MSGSVSRSIAMRCSAERPCRPKTSRSPRTTRTCLSGVTRPSAEEPPPSSRSPVWHGSSRASSTSATPSANREDTSSGVAATSAVPVQPVVVTSWPWYSSAGRPTEAALTRSGMSLVTRVTGLLAVASAARLSAQARMRESFSAVRNPAGSTDGSVWLSSTRSVPPSGVIGIGSSRRPCRMRRSSSRRSASRANQPSSEWWRLPSSSETTTSGRTTSCSAKRVGAHGSLTGARRCRGRNSARRRRPRRDR